MVGSGCRRNAIYEQAREREFSEPAPLHAETYSSREPELVRCTQTQSTIPRKGNSRYPDPSSPSPATAMDRVARSPPSSCRTSGSTSLCWPSFHRSKSKIKFLIFLLLLPSCLLWLLVRAEQGLLSSAEKDLLTNDAFDITSLANEPPFSERKCPLLVA